VIRQPAEGVSISDRRCSGAVQDGTREAADIHGDESMKLLSTIARLSLAAALALGIASAAHAGGATKMSMAEKDIVETAVSAGDFNTLVAAVKAAGLVDTLKGEGPFTVFAPTDAAFAALPEGTVASLLLPENKQKLVAILTYHVVPGRVMSQDIAGKSLSAETVQGGKLAIDATDGVKVNDAKVVAADIATANGVIHVIDKVVLPN
jgi:uncharacterized surface protein with fasciclin (FAS1) repeats